MKRVGLVLLGVVCLKGWAIDILPDLNSRCEKIQLNKELTIYKDPELFRENIRAYSEDPENAWPEEGPVYTKKKGVVSFIRGEVQPFKGFEKYKKMFKRYLPKEIIAKNDIPNIIFVRMCDQNDADQHALGFVFESSLEQAVAEELQEGHLPPSIRRIPKLP